ncbi:hypothetical protein PRJ39_06220 [Lysobacter enzymogenes]|uniref:hypothetical protein n=1 Tax=Lysobacter enzymogenes TaxID=69 RepID=UPI0037499B3C
MTTQLLQPYQLRVRFSLSRELASYRSMMRELSGYYVEPELVWVIERKTMCQCEHRVFTRDFTKPQYWITPFNSRPGHCIMVVAPGMLPLYVRAEGHSYARYVGLAAEET